MLKLYNSLTKKIEEFKLIQPPQVGMYTCGPTVYQFAHIGNFRSYSTADILVRVLKYNGFDVNFVMNITDVGHMTQDQIEGGDSGEDKIEKTASQEGKSVWEVSKFYTDVFLKDYKSLNLTSSAVLCKATDHIREQIDLIKEIEANGFTYETSDGIYFDTSLLPDYGKLSSLDQIKENSSDIVGVSRIGTNTEKKNPRDFALWKFSSSTEGGQKRQMEWKSPWGMGFPGWHIECSAMSMKYLGVPFDIHTGGMDHKEIHHPNEIAQTEAATHKLLANYWVHTAFMLVAGQKMSKSLKNTYTLYDLEKEPRPDGGKGYSPMALRYLYFQTHYRQEMNFTFPALEAASNALKKLYEDVAQWEEPVSSNVHIEKKDEESCGDFEERFLEAVNEDLNMSQALAVMWELVKSDYPSALKAESLFSMDEVLGFDIQNTARFIKNKEGIIPEEIQELVRERKRLRKEKHFNLADQVRSKIEKLGYTIEDTKKGIKVRKKD